MIHWNVSPDLVHLGPVVVRWYGLFFATSFLLGYQVMSRIYTWDGIPTKDMDRLLIYVAIGTVVGARLGHTLFYEPDVYLADPIRILKVWEGGLASHGAFLGIVTALYLYRRKTRTLNYLQLLDRISIPVALAGGFIRLGNLFNSEIIGRPASVPWAFVFSRVDQVPRHPTQLYESVSYFLTFVLLGSLFRKKQVRVSQGMTIGLFLILVFGMRFLIEFVKENQVGFESALPLNLGQLLSIPLVLLGAWLVWRSRKYRAEKGSKRHAAAR